MEKKKKLNVLLAVTDQLRGSYKSMVNFYTKYFASKQGHFKGEKNTFEARDGMADEPGKRSLVRVATSVQEKIDYFIDTTAKFVDCLFSQERTNALGKAQAELIVEGTSWGTFTSLELLRLRSLIESADLGSLTNMINHIPVRSDAEIWEKSNNEEYSGRAIYQTKLQSSETKTTEKSAYIPVDPNLKGRELPANYTSPVQYHEKVVVKGDATHQRFSGEWSQREKALALNRVDKLLTAITESLKVANDCEIEQSELKADKIFGYIFYGHQKD